MATLIQKLLKLQECDVQLVKLLRENRDIPKRRDELNGTVTARKTSLAAVMEQQQLRIAKQRQLEGDIEELKEKIKKYRDQQFQIKNNDQYKVLDREIQVSLEEVARVEEQLLVVLEEIDRIKQRASEIEVLVQQDEKLVAEDMELLDMRADKVGSRIAKLRAKRQGLKEGIPQDALSYYERLIKRKGDEVVVALDENEREMVRSCSGCHMTVPPQTANNALKQDAITTCTFCGRILYREE
ncbi:MAG: hypothetical protein EOL87_01680 [Spartobacteria bacterium]|nr:hypothetical protein [Spartobacteria bacterium]